MSATLTTPVSTEELQALLAAALAEKNRPNGMTDDQLRQLFAAAGSQRNNPGFLERWDEGIAEYRREIQEQWERELANEERK